MSHTPPDAHAPVESKTYGTLVTALLAVAAFSVFIIIVLIAYKSPSPVDRAVGPVEDADVWKISSEGRKARLVELRGKEAAALTSYAWIDQPAGVIRLPMDRATELTIAELKAKQARK